jgi:hypothetical protein
VHEILLVASDTAEGLVLAPLAQRASRARRLIASRSGLLEALSESRVAAAILDGTTLEQRNVSFDEDVTHADSSLGPAAELEAGRIADLRRWMEQQPTRIAVDGYPVAVLSHVKTDMPTGVIRACMLTLSAADGAIVHTEVVALHQAMNVRWTSKPDGIRRLIAKFSLRQETLHEFRHLFEDRIEQVRVSCARVAAALAGRENTVAATSVSSARQLVQRGLFEKRAEMDGEERARVASAARDESTQRLTSLAGWHRLTPSLRLLAILLVNGREHS